MQYGEFLGSCVFSRVEITQLCYLLQPLVFQLVEWVFERKIWGSDLGPVNSDHRLY